MPYLRCFSTAAAIAMAAARGMWEVAGTAVCVATAGNGFWDRMCLYPSPYDCRLIVGVTIETLLP